MGRSEVRPGAFAIRNSKFAIPKRSSFIQQTLTNSKLNLNLNLSLSLTLILLFSVILRVAAALYLGDGVAELPGISDQLSYHSLALRVLEGHGFSFATDWWPATRAGEPTAHWSYLYTLYLAAVYWLFGPHPLAARLIQAVIAGALHPWLAWRIARRVFSARVGLVAAALTAIYAYFIYYAAALMTETFYILAILWALDLAMGISESANQRIGESASWQIGRWLLLGVALGVAALLRQVILLFVPFLFAWLCWTTRNTQHAIRNTQYVSRILCTLFVLVALILPWTIRNYHVFARFVLLNTNAGYAFFWANHPIYGTNFVAILPPDGPSYQELIPPELRHLDEAALDQALFREGLRFVVEDPIRYALLSLSRVKDYFKFWPSRQSSLISNIARVGSFGVCLPLMLYGLVKAKVEAKAEAKVKAKAPSISALTLALAFVSIYTAIHLLSWALIRYRLPVDAVLLLFAALAIADLTGRIWNGTQMTQMLADSRR